MKSEGPSKKSLLIKLVSGVLLLSYKQFDLFKFEELVKLLNLKLVLY
mgnify:CR=1|jgi:hypothetical protein